MGTGSGLGGSGRRGAKCPLNAFLQDEGGYTSIAVAVALLVSFSLVFSLATVQWITSRSADVQEVADACALAGQTPVAAFSTIAQVLDACVLSLGIVGLVVFGIGLVLAAVPGAQAISAKVVELGKNVADARRKFAKSSSAGLRELERALPYLVVINSARALRKNSAGEEYVGCAIPFPQQPQSDYQGLENDLNTDELEDAAKRLQDASQRSEEAKSLADAARERGWRADCVDNPSCLRQRAESLAGMGGIANPNYSSPSLWNFGVPLSRSRSYYLSRVAQESPKGEGIEDRTDSAVRRAFYLYALRVLSDASYSEMPDGHVEVSLPSFPCNAAEVRQTTLFSDALWPCTLEADGLKLHSCMECPGAKGPFVGNSSLAAQEAGQAGVCEVCRMSVGDMGKVAAISTNATNGYEHYWKTVVEASQQYQEARNAQADADEEVRKISGEGVGAFERALDQLKVARPRLMPPGAWGCVAVVGRPQSKVTPSGLAAFGGAGSLPPGAAISAAALATDNQTSHNNVLSRVFDGIRGEGFSIGGVLGDLTGAWGEFLVGYGAAYGSVSSQANRMLDAVDGVFGGTVGSWLRQKISSAIEAAGLSPGEMRLRKPVLVGTREVLNEAGYDGAEKARDMLNHLPDHGSSEEVARALGLWVFDQVRTKKFTVAELPIPGTQWTIPLDVDLGKLGG